MVELRAERSGFQKTTSIWLVVEDGHRQTAVSRSIEFTPIERHECLPEPPIRIDDAEAQQWIDELWRAGFRPTEGTGSAGSLAATERHLEDMRRLVFADRIEVHGSPRINVPAMRGEG